MNVRTTIIIDEGLLKEIKILAVRKDMNISELIKKALENYLKENK